MGEILFLSNSALFFTLRESRRGRISFVAKGSRYTYTASPLTPRICNPLGFCNIKVYPGLKDEILRGVYPAAGGTQDDG